MKTKSFAAVGMLTIASLAFTHGFAQQQKQNNNNPTMKSLISIVEIPVTDFSRAKKFYQSILAVAIEEVDMGGTQMGVFSSDANAVNVALVKGSDYQPVNHGVIVYWNAGEDLTPMLTKIKQNGGKVIIPKTEISPEMGYFAIFSDTEGNKLGLHSAK